MIMTGDKEIIMTPSLSNPLPVKIMSNILTQMHRDVQECKCAMLKNSPE